MVSADKESYRKVATVIPNLRKVQESSGKGNRQKKLKKHKKENALKTRKWRENRKKGHQAVVIIKDENRNEKGVAMNF